VDKDAMSRLTRGQRKALDLLRLARATDPSTDDGTVAICATFYDHEVDVAYVYHRTADALVNLGLVEYGYWDESGTELKLTEAGRV
jgi:hypothetical protein